MPLEADTLERLLIDRALGALPPDVEALLDAHLCRDPDAAQAGGDFARAVHLARSALAAGQAGQHESLPSLSGAVARARRSWPWARAIARHAAVLAAGLLLGIAWQIRTNRPGPAPAPTAPAQGLRRTDTGLAGQAVEGQSDLWSVQRLYRQAAASPRHPPKVIWESPVQTPRLGDPT